MAILIGRSRVVLPTKSRKLFKVVAMHAVYHHSTDAYVGTRTVIDRTFTSLDAAVTYMIEQNEGYGHEDLHFVVVMPNGTPYSEGDFLNFMPYAWPTLLATGRHFGEEPPF